MGQPLVLKELRRRRTRRRKLAVLRKRYLSGSGESEKKKIWQKVVKIAPWLSLKYFMDG